LVLVAIDGTLFTLDRDIVEADRCVVRIGGLARDFVGLCLGIYAE